MKYFAFALLALLTTAVNAQQTFVVNPGQRIGDVVNQKDFYTYPSFSQGTVYFNDGTTANALLNYNSLYGEMQFIDQKGDTLSLADETRIKIITVSTDSFYVDHGYLRLLRSSKKLKVLSRDILRQTSSSKVGLYNQSVEGGAATSYTVLSSGAHDANLVVNEKVTFKREVTYFFSDDAGHLLPATRKNAEKLSGQKAAIADYFAKNNVDFKSEADLENMITYLQTH